MAIRRKVFYSFFYDDDVFRVQQIRNFGALEENKPVLANVWEEVKKGGDPAIQKWIDDAMKDKSCVVVLIGANTINRPWVRYEIQKAWNDGKGLVGIHIHNLKCPIQSKTLPYTYGVSSKGRNPIETFNVRGQNLSNIVKTYDPGGPSAYQTIRDNLEKWIEEAIAIRAKF